MSPITTSGRGGVLPHHGVSFALINHLHRGTLWRVRLAGDPAPSFLLPARPSSERRNRRWNPGGQTFALGGAVNETVSSFAANRKKVDPLICIERMRHRGQADQCGSSDFCLISRASRRRFHHNRSRWARWRSLDAGRERDREGRKSEHPEVAVRRIVGEQLVGWLIFAATSAQHAPVRQQYGRRVVTAVDLFVRHQSPLVRCGIPELGCVDGLAWRQIIESLSRLRRPGPCVPPVTRIVPSARSVALCWRRLKTHRSSQNPRRLPHRSGRLFLQFCDGRCVPPVVATPEEYDLARVIHQPRVHTHEGQPDGSPTGCQAPVPTVSKKKASGLALTLKTRPSGAR